MDSLDQLLSAQASGGAAPAGASAAPAGDSLDALLSARASGQNLAPAPTPAEPSMWNDLGHQLGLTARAAVTGITSLPTMVGDAVNTAANYGIRGVNSATGANIPELAMPSSAVQQGFDAIGVAQPQNATERVVQDAASTVAGIPTGMGVGKVLQGTTKPVVQAIGQTLQLAPGMQMAGAAGAGAGSGSARELGLGPGWQIGAGVLGGTAGVLAASGATSAARAIGNRLVSTPPLSPAAAAARADSGVDQAIRELGPQGAQSYESAPPQGAPATGQATANSTFDPLQPIKDQVAQALQQNPDVNPAAVMRAQDFRSLGMDPTLGQITRDPMQYAAESNIRGTPPGAAITNRFNQQNAQLQQALTGLTGTPSDAYQAGSTIKSALKSIDDQMGQQVSDAYAAARASSGKNLDVPLTGVAQDYAQALNDFGDKVPSGVRNNFNQLGLMTGTQQKTFTIENAENLLKVINANQSNDPATNAALGQLRNSVKNAILSADDQGGVYAPARALAAQRFALQDQIPALGAASADSVNADDFVRRFVIGGKTDEVSAMANLLQQQSPEAFQVARNQIGSQLASKGFGVNPAGDAKFNPSPYIQQMTAFGPTKLAAFYTPDELAQLNTIGRVGAYMNSFPSAAPVNTSNTASAIASLLSSGVKKVPIVGGLIDNAQNRMFVNKALAGRLSDATSQGANNASQRALGALLVNSASRPPSRNP